MSPPKVAEVKAEPATKPKQAPVQPVKKAAVIEKKKVAEPVQKQTLPKVTAAKATPAKGTPAKPVAKSSSQTKKNATKPATQKLAAKSVEKPSQPVVEKQALVQAPPAEEKVEEAKP